MCLLSFLRWGMRLFSANPEDRCVVAALCAVDLRSSHQFEDEICNASSENGLFFPKMEFSVWTTVVYVAIVNPTREKKARTLFMSLPSF